MSPEAITGIDTRSTSSAVSVWSAVPVYICLAERGCSVSAATPSASSFGPRSRAVREPFSKSSAHLHRDRHVDRVDHRPGQATGEVVLLQRAGSGSGLGDLAHGAAEVDVDDVGARSDHHLGRLGHPLGLGAKDLDGQRMFVPGDPQVPQSALVAVGQSARGNHLRAHQPGPESTSLAAERLHRDTGHRRQHDPGGNLDIPDVPVLGQRVHGRILASVLECDVCGHMETGIIRRSSVSAQRKSAANRALWGTPFVFASEPGWAPTKDVSVEKDVILTPEGYERLKTQIDRTRNDQASRGG